MPSDSLQEPEARRAYRRQLRAITRLLRWSGAALVLLGAAGLALGTSDKWFFAPSWVSLVLGWALIFSAAISRARPTGVNPD